MHTSEIFQRAIDFIEEHLDEPLELEQIATAAAMSVPNLYRMFYAMTGHPVKEYIRKRRTSEAAFLLRSTDLPTIDIGFRCGFDSYQTFLRTFKRNTNLTPGLYRQTELIFSFERIDLNECVAYMEEREVSERYPGVKVIQLAPLKRIGYLHTADSVIGLEDEALTMFRLHLKNSGIDSRQIRLFGWNVDLDKESHHFGYQLAAVSEKEFLAGAPNLQPIEFPGGLYAVTRTPAGTGTVIVAAWNQLLSEWLLRSTFELGEHSLLEEYQQYGDKISRLKLYLPVRCEQAVRTIEIVERPPVKVISFRAEGNDCVSQADNESVDWLSRNGFAGDSRLQLFMSCSFPPGESNTYEVHIAAPEGFVPTEEDVTRETQLEGGLYACLTTGPYGMMTGALERIYRWIGSSVDYELDGSRYWYAHYTDFEDQVSVKCYVPIIKRI
ncbi:helix-turn-helix domain-containing protein [Paenibacillus sp.]|jgi:AraC-like DNA-binding protein/DNA gyrase inhibitor GyrI|uniref:helix-turn-helix domain-containing protein n=1 Tax=Paenibacillus sp. TaxID=58172 RepID=UPI002831E1A2|nr:helix-turn-helix domain-containing protein [Paenibacillus sp.]MDR0271241.1 effector binding domain-containing protein [Paenibacillus sp.]